MYVSVGISASSFVDETVYLGIVTEYSAEPVFQEFLKVHAFHIPLRVFLSIPQGL
jgi:hypothetical protein